MESIKQIKRIIGKAFAVSLASFLFFACSAKMSDPVELQAKEPYYGGASPVPVLLDLSGGQILKGGSTKNVHFTVTDALGFNSNKIEYSRNDGVTWQTAVSARGVDVVHYPSLSGENTTFDWLVPSETNCAASSLTSDATTYKIRMTSSGRPDAKPVVVQSTSSFTVDSCAPTIAANGFTNLATYNHGFAKVQLAGVVDSYNLTPVTHVCVNKTGTAPLVTDSCWTSVLALGVTASTSSVTINIPYFLGFLAVSDPLYVWVKDAADNISTLASVEAKDKLTLTRSCTPASNCNSLAYSTLTCYNSSVASVTVINKTGVPAAAANTTMLDPGLFVVTSEGTIYIRDKVAGIVKIDLLANTSTTLIGLNATSVDGDLSTAKVKKPMRIALDSKENLIIYDYDRIRRLNVHATIPNVETLIGGSLPSDTSDNLTDPTKLSITYHDNLLWYSTFAVLPNDSIVFNSEDPSLALNPAAGSRFKLRLYQPDQTNKITSIKFSGTGVYGNTSLVVSELFPYGPMGIIFDKVTNLITKFYARLCIDAASCATHNSALFSGTAVAVAGAPQNMTSWSNGSYVISRKGELWAANAYEGVVYKLNSLNTKDLKLGYGFGAGCTDGMSATTNASCTINLWDVFIGLDDVLYFIDNGKIRFVDTDGNVKTLVQ